MTQNFTCNISDGIGAYNLSVFVWNSTGSLVFNATALLNATYNLTNWSYTLPYNDTFHWSCLGFNNNSLYNLSAEGNYTLIPLRSPIITYVQPVAALNPVESATLIAAFNFTAASTAGNTTFNASKTKVIVNMSGIYRTSSGCYALTINATAVNMSCNVSMNYYDVSGVWSVNISLNDNLGNYVENLSSTFTYNELQAVALSANALSFGPAASSLENVSTTPLIINNTGNVNFSTISLTAFDLANGTYFIGSGNFSANISNNSVGNVMKNNSVVNVTGAYLTRNNDTYISNETIYIFVDVPSAMPALKYNSISGWIVSLTK